METRGTYLDNAHFCSIKNTTYWFKLEFSLSLSLPSMLVNKCYITVGQFFSLTQQHYSLATASRETTHCTTVTKYTLIFISGCVQMIVHTIDSDFTCHQSIEICENKSATVGHEAAFQAHLMASLFSGPTALSKHIDLQRYL